jgi:hypothetical protein
MDNPTDFRVVEVKSDAYIGMLVQHKLLQGLK